MSHKNPYNYSPPYEPVQPYNLEPKTKRNLQFQIFIFIYVLNTEYWSVIFLGLTKFIKKSQKVYLVIISFSNDQMSEFLLDSRE